jgi:hypothetical protein
LTIKTINGRNGPFNVGRLLAEEGEFAVKESLLDQYEEGRYEGDFGVSRIYPSYYIAGGRIVVEVRATVETVALAGIEGLAPEDAAPMEEPDPMEEVPQAQASQGVPAKEQAEVPEATQAPVAEESTDEALFGSLWPLGTSVKLDPTVDRKAFRAQRDRLKQLGYRFQAVGQVWNRGPGAAPDGQDA